MANYDGRATAGLTTGIIGTSLGAINSGLLGNIGGLFGNNCNGAMYACSDNMAVNRYEMGQQKALIDAQAEIAYLRSRDAAKDDGLALYKYIDGQLKDVRDTLCHQAVHNQRTEDSFALVRQDIAAVRNELRKDIEIEAERRCCGDNSIVTYANATFYPKLVADVTAGTTTTAQTLYNPLPNCGGGCCNN